MEYRYQVSGRTHFGLYEEAFASEEAAREFWSNLQSLPAVVRYNPKQPRISVMAPYRDVRA